MKKFYAMIALSILFAGCSSHEGHKGHYEKRHADAWLEFEPISFDPYTVIPVWHDAYDYDYWVCETCQEAGR